jgi:hypothetical protein
MTMPNPFVREIGRVTDLDGIPVTVGVDHDTVTISGSKFDRARWSHLTRLTGLAVAAAAEYEAMRAEELGDA